MNNGTNAEKSVRVGISQSSPETKRGERLKNAPTRRASPSSRRISMESMNADNNPRAISPKSKRRIDASIGVAEIDVKAARKKKLPLGWLSGYNPSRLSG